MNKAYLILGGNIGDRLDNLNKAITFIEQHIGRIIKKSDVFETAAWGNTNQPDFYNQAICIETSFQALPLLEALLSIEKDLGRTRNDDQKWLERTIDIDLLFYNNETINEPGLSVPHPQIQERRFVLTPIVQIAPGLVHPVLLKTLKILLDECTDPLEVQLLEKSIKD